MAEGVTLIIELKKQNDCAQGVAAITVNSYNAQQLTLLCNEPNAVSTGHRNERPA